MLHCSSFCHVNKFLVCVNIPDNKAHSDSDSDSKNWKSKVAGDARTRSSSLVFFFEEQQHVIKKQKKKKR